MGDVELDLRVRYGGFGTVSRPVVYHFSVSYYSSPSVRMPISGFSIREVLMVLLL